MKTLNVEKVFHKISPTQAATITGLAVVLMTIAAVVATDLTIETLIVQDNPKATFENIFSNPTVFRIGVFGWVAVLLCDIVIAWGFYMLFKSVNAGISLATAWIRLVYAAILGTAMGNLVQLTLLLSPMLEETRLPLDYFITETWLYLEGFYAVWSMGLIVFGVHIILLGLLSLKSANIPNWLGILLTIGGFGYLVVHLAKLLVPDHQDFIQILEWIFILPMLSEVALGIWILIKRKSFE